MSIDPLWHSGSGNNCSTDGLITLTCVCLTVSATAPVAFFVHATLQNSLIKEKARSREDLDNEFLRFFLSDSCLSSCLWLPVSIK